MPERTYSAEKYAKMVQQLVGDVSPVIRARDGRMGCRENASQSIAASIRFHREHSAIEADIWALQESPTTASSLRQFAGPKQCQRSRQQAAPIAIGTDIMGNSAVVVERPHFVHKVSFFGVFSWPETWRAI